MTPTLFGILAVILALWGGNLYLERRAIRRMHHYARMFRGKMLRHAPSGTVGRVLGTACRPHLWFSWYRTTYAVQLVVCPECLHILSRSNSAAHAVSLLLHARAAGGIHDYPPADLAAALPSEIHAFHQGGQTHE